MMFGGNTGATLETSMSSNAVVGYQERLVSGRCTYPGCDQAPADDCNECPYHRLKSAARRRRSRLKNRKLWTRKKLCLRCGGRRKPGSRWCVICLERAGKLRLPERDKERDKNDSGWKETIEQSPDGKLRARRRFAGQGKRGRQSGAQLDEQDRIDATRAMERGFRLLAYSQTDEAKQLPKAQRDDIRDEGTAYLEQAQRWLEDIIDRNSPKSRKAVDPSEDE